MHTYRPLLSYVGGGQASLRSAERTQRSVTPRRCTWLQDTALVVDAAAKTVRCASGRTYGYTDLVLGPGLVPDTDALPGIDAALHTSAVASNYVDRAEETWKLVQAMPAGGQRCSRCRARRSAAPEPLSNRCSWPPRTGSTPDGCRVSTSRWSSTAPSYWVFRTSTPGS
ncbi:hypothetical protein [Rhodococcus oxybenzonivorans]|uniref:hypothetical protein n=1 Tax=Rhodococcus oxybenzonivorans TaxID=1990687 RepID=UPI001E63F54D|nr:hypothetical protein [Rhodococcus oxybenzonivorans]